MITIRRLLLAAVLSLATGLCAAGEMDALIQDCNGCHGDAGVSRWGDVPTIAGIDEFVHSEALFVYRDEARPCADSAYRQGDTGRPDTNMCQIVRDMSDGDIEAIAAHYAGLPFVAAPQEFDAELAATGEALHERECGRCHSDGGANPADESSILAGQWLGYLESTFAQYASGEREQPAKMKEKMDQLSSDDVKALLHYYASQQ